MMPSSDPALEQAFEYLFPLYEMARTRYNLIESPRNPGRLPPGRFQHRRLLADHRSRAVTTPNNDTLYSSTWLDLSCTTVMLSVPEIEDRYWSVAMIDVFTNNFAMLGCRLDEEGPLRVLLVGPAWQGNEPADARVIRAPSNDVWLLGRWLIDDANDAPAVHELQNAMRIEIRALDREPHPQRIAVGLSSDPANFLAVVNEMLGRNPVPAAEAPMLAQWSSLGVRPGATDAWETLSPDIQARWIAGIEAAHQPLQAGLSSGARRIGGWAFPPAALGNYGTDYRLRAAVALGGLAALEPVECLYLSRDEAADGQPLDGSHSYRMRVPAGGLPNDGFWSLSMYEVLADGRCFFVENPIGRYAVGDRSRGLVRNDDGTMDLWIARERPAAADPRAANWLPAPTGRFRLTLRAYLARPALLDGTAALPTLEQVD
jgi:hypothetical protein